MEPAQCLLGVLLFLFGGFGVTRYTQLVIKKFTKEQDNFEAESTLCFVFSIFRHGVRSPAFPSFPTDPYQNRSEFFPDGDGALSKPGKQLMYRVGSIIRKRYNSYLRPTYSDEVRFVSTNMERTMMSAMLVSTGMFPPEQYQKWSKNINWQPIPVWLDNNETDKTLLWSDSTSCPRFGKDSSYLEAQCKLPDTNPEHNFYEYISQQTGDLRNSIYDIFALWDIFECELLSGYKLPEWTKKIYPDKIRDIVAETFNLMVNRTSSMLKILSGPLYYRVYDLLRSKVNGNLTQGHKMYLHAGHDISVLSLLRGIGYKPLHIVRPGDCVFLELHNLSNIYYVKIFYLSLLTTGEEFRELHVPGCPLPCPLSTFLTLATPLSPPQWAAECSS